MRVFEVMSDDVRTVAPTTPVEEARAIMQSNRVPYLVVTAKRHHVVGVLSQSDLNGPLPPGATVQDRMTAHVVTVEQAETVRKAANLMEGRTVGCLPVTDDGRLVGIVTISDLLRLMGKGIERPEPKRRRFAHHRVPHRKMHIASGRW